MFYAYFYTQEWLDYELQDYGVVKIPEDSLAADTGHFNTTWVCSNPSSKVSVANSIKFPTAYIIESRGINSSNVLK